MTSIPGKSQSASTRMSSNSLQDEGFRKYDDHLHLAPARSPGHQPVTNAFFLQTGCRSFHPTNSIKAPGMWCESLLNVNHFLAILRDHWNTSITFRVICLYMHNSCLTGQPGKLAPVCQISLDFAAARDDRLWSVVAVEEGDHPGWHFAGCGIWGWKFGILAFALQCVSTNLHLFLIYSSTDWLFCSPTRYKVWSEGIIDNSSRTLLFGCTPGRNEKMLGVKHRD